MSLAHQAGRFPTNNHDHTASLRRQLDRPTTGGDGHHASGIAAPINRYESVDYIDRELGKGSGQLKFTAFKQTAVQLKDWYVACCG